MNGRVLCVDPDAEERTATADALRAAGFEVTTAERLAAGRAALDGRPDCLVTEASLPDGDGMELVAAARERDPDVAAVLFTDAGYDEVGTGRYDEVVEVVPKAGADAHDVLVDIVETTVAERRQTDYPLPDDEDERLAALAAYDLDDEATLAALDRLTTLAAARFGVDMASINIIGEDDQRLLVCEGLETGTGPRSESVCTFTILDDGVTVIEDVRDDPRFASNETVAALGIRFYAGARVRTPAGQVLGTFCLYDDEPRSMTPAATADLERFAAEAAEQLELRRRLSAAADDESVGGPAVHVEPGGES